LVEFRDMGMMKAEEVSNCPHSPTLLGGEGGMCIFREKEKYII
jgi:hypothetical protein